MAHAVGGVDRAAWVREEFGTGARSLAGSDDDLNISRYVDSSEPEDVRDIDAHLHGGIANADIDRLQPYWEEFSARRAALFESRGRPEFSTVVSRRRRLRLPSWLAGGRDASADLRARFNAWSDRVRARMYCLNANVRVKELIRDRAELVLHRHMAPSLRRPWLRCVRTVRRVFVPIRSASLWPGRRVGPACVGCVPRRCA